MKLVCVFDAMTTAPLPPTPPVQWSSLIFPS
jgi:hypothetical protein